MIRCYDVVSMLTDEAAERSAGVAMEVPEEKANLLGFCETLDEITTLVGNARMNTSVDIETMEISISLSFDSSEIRGICSELNALLLRSKRVEFLPGEDNARVKFLFTLDGIWIRTGSEYER